MIAFKKLKDIKNLSQIAHCNYFDKSSFMAGRVEYSAEDQQLLNKLINFSNNYFEKISG